MDPNKTAQKLLLLGLLFLCFLYVILARNKTVILYYRYFLCLRYVVVALIYYEIIKSWNKLSQCQFRTEYQRVSKLEQILLLRLIFCDIFYLLVLFFNGKVDCNFGIWCIEPLIIYALRLKLVDRTSKCLYE